MFLIVTSTIRNKADGSLFMDSEKEQVGRQSRVGKLTSSLFPPIRIGRSSQSEPSMTRRQLNARTSPGQSSATRTGNKTKKPASRSPSSPQVMDRRPATYPSTDEVNTTLPNIISSRSPAAVASRRTRLNNTDTGGLQKDKSRTRRHTDMPDALSGPNLHHDRPFLGHRKPKIFEKYKPLKEIGKGVFGQVFAVEERYIASRVTDETDGNLNAAWHHVSREMTRQARIFACKVIDIAPKQQGKQTSPLEGVMNEIQMMVDIGGGHPNVQDLVDFVVEDDKAYIVSSLCQGGDLAQALEMRGCLCEEDARNVTAGIINGLAHLHYRGVAHRDIKLENVLLCDSKHDFSKVKIIDMGFAKQLASQDASPYAEALHTVCGTPIYIAPEMLQPTLRTGVIQAEARYGTQADMWSTGIILYYLLSGYPPFDITGGQTVMDVFQEIEKASFDFEDPVWETVSDDAMDLIECLLEPDPAMRLTAKEALRHPWISVR